LPHGFPESATRLPEWLIAKLIEARKAYDQKGDDGREAAKLALASLAELIETDPRAAALGLVVPITNLGMALVDLDDGGRPAIFEPASKGGRPPPTFNRSAAIAYAAASLSNLERIGVDPEEAAAAVADKLNTHGFTLSAKRTIDAVTVKNWRTHIEAGRRDKRLTSMYREILALDELRAEAMRKGVTAGTVTLVTVKDNVLAGLTQAVSLVGEI
jgi:hypothetical protein